MNTGNLAPGARIIVRDAEWLVRRIDRTSTGSQALSVVGLSELVKEKEAVFLHTHPTGFLKKVLEQFV
jgi:hypothetical protein